MKSLIPSLASLVLAVAFLGGCATSGDEQGAGVEERRPAASAPGGTAGGATDKPRVATVDLTSKPGAAGSASVLKDPANILSRRSIYYEFDKFDVRDEYRPLVEAHAKYLRENPATKMLIQGNTDERGSREYNVALGQRRADGVKRMLLLLGAKDAQIEAVSLGEEKPKAQGSTEQAWAENRRSDMLYGGEF